MSRRFDACSPPVTATSVTAMLFVMAMGLIAAAGCTADRFQSVGCVADSECRADRVCSQNRCVSLEQADREEREDQENPDEESPDIGPDVQPDTPPDDETDDETEEAISQFVGSWRTEVSATMTSPDGGTAPPPVPSTLVVDISRGEGSDLLVEIDFSFICPLEADVDPDGPTFDVVTQECQTGGDTMSLSFWNISSQGQIAADGDLVFDFSSSASYTDSGDARDFVLEMTLKGPRID